MGMLTIQHCEEDLSKAYITAVVAMSKNLLKWNADHDYGVDASVKQLRRTGTRIRETGWGFEIQAKSTTNWQISGNEVIYDVESKTYNDLVDRSLRPRGLPLILVLFCLDPETQNWLQVCESKMTLKKCAYWLKLDSQINETPTENTRTKRIRIPRSNLFDSRAVESLLNDIALGTLLP